jgi:3-oxoacyl-[acyl-carrier protein] reductase
MAQHLSGPPSLAGQVALITGGSGGMGRAIAKLFNGARARVVATDLSKHEDLGPGIEYRRHDITSRAETDHVIDGVLADHGKVDILVLCAGIIARTPLSTSTDEEWNYCTNICFDGPDMRTAYITLSGYGQLFEARWPRPGLNVSVWRG